MGAKPATARRINPAAENRAESFSRLARAQRWRRLKERNAALWELEHSRQARMAARLWGFYLP